MKKMVGRRVLGFAMASVMAMGMGTAAMAEETTYPMDTDCLLYTSGIDNGDPACHEQWKETKGRHAFNGMAYAVIRAGRCV